MAFVSSNLAVFAQANGHALWHYKTPDTADECDTAGYFNGAYDQLKIGDFILLFATTGGTAQFGILAVKDRASGVVDTANFTNFASSDTD